MDKLDTQTYSQALLIVSLKDLNSQTWDTLRSAERITTQAFKFVAKDLSKCEMETILNNVETRIQDRSGFYHTKFFLSLEEHLKAELEALRSSEDLTEISSEKSFLNSQPSHSKSEKVAPQPLALASAQPALESVLQPDLLPDLLPVLKFALQSALQSGSNSALQSALQSASQSASQLASQSASQSAFLSNLLPALQSSPQPKRNIVRSFELLNLVLSLILKINLVVFLILFIVDRYHTN